MTADRSIPEGSPPHATLFESFPDPLLAYATGSESDSSTGERVSGGATPSVRAINPAFESTFDTGATEIVGTPLDECHLTGTVTVHRAGSGPTARRGASGPGITEAERRPQERAPDEDDPPRPTPPVSATAGWIRERLSDTGGDVRVVVETDDPSRYFRVRSIETDPTDAICYLLFTDVTDLVEERRDLARTVEHLDRITSVASHDIRNPLEVANIRLEAARDTGDAVHFEKVGGALDRIERLVLDVLAAGSGRVESADAISIETVAEEAWDTVDTAAAALEIDTDVPTVRGDADRLQQLFENLFRNAVEHGGSGVTITITSARDGFVVADDGPGIPPAIRDQVFEAGVSSAEENSGLGLSIVRRIAREHGWNVSLDASRVPDPHETGARFAFTGVEDVGSDGDAGEYGGEPGSGCGGGSNGSS